MADTNSAAAITSSTDSLTSGGSAAPASTGNPANTGTGYSAQAADARTDERPGADGGARSPNAQTDDSMTPEQLRAALKAARDEAAANRKARQELADLQRSLEDAKLSETEKLQKQIADLQRERDTVTQQSQERVIRGDVRAAAKDLGLKPELAYRLIDYSAITFNDDGDPTNIQELLSQAMTDYGLAPASPAAAAPSQRGAAASPASAPTSGRAAAAQSGGATNPGAGRGPGVFTKAQIARMSPREYEANKAAIYEAMRNGQVR